MSAPMWAQRLIKLGEENGETVQAQAKILLHGPEGVYDNGETNKHALERELGDLFAIVELMASKGELDIFTIEACKNLKLAKLKMLGFDKD